MSSKSKAIIELPSPPQLSQLLKFWDTTGGRDKSCRTVQFFCKFLVYFYSQNPLLGSAELVKKLSTLSAQLSSARKAFRLFKTLNFYQSLAGLLNQPLPKGDDAVIFVLSVLRALGFALYMGYDSYGWLGGIGMFKDAQLKERGRTGNWWWLVGLGAGVAQTGFKIHLDLKKDAVLQKSIKSGTDAKAVQDAKDSSAKVRASVQDKAIALARDSLDFLIPWGLLEAGSWYPNAGIVGLAGTLSSLIAIYETYPKQ